MSRIYLDACSIIYLVEAKSPFHAVVVSRLLQHPNRSSVATSDFRGYRAWSAGHAPSETTIGRQLAAYDKLFGANRMMIVEITAEFVARASNVTGAATVSRHQTRFTWPRPSKRRLMSF